MNSQGLVEKITHVYTDSSCSVPLQVKNLKPKFNTLLSPAVTNAANGSTTSFAYESDISVQKLNAKMCDEETSSTYFCTKNQNVFSSLVGLTVTYYQSQRCSSTISSTSGNILSSNIISRQVVPMNGCINFKDMYHGGSSTQHNFGALSGEDEADSKDAGEDDDGEVEVGSGGEGDEEVDTTGVNAAAPFGGSQRVVGCVNNAVTGLRTASVLVYPLPNCQGVGVPSQERTGGRCMTDYTNSQGLSSLVTCYDGVPTAAPTVEPSPGEPTAMPISNPTLVPTPLPPLPTQSPTPGPTPPPINPLPTNAPTAFSSASYSYTASSLQTFTVPPGANYLLFKVWGAGGGGASSPAIFASVDAGFKAGSSIYGGGAGGYAQCLMPVTPGTSYSLLAGQGGITGATSSAYGGGGTATSYFTSSTGYFFPGGGGGRSAVQYPVGVDIVTAGGGGGGGYIQVGTTMPAPYIGSGGGGGGVAGGSIYSAIQTAISPSGQCVSYGGTQNAPGYSSNCAGWISAKNAYGSKYTGGNGGGTLGNYGAGGGGGYYGGGGSGYGIPSGTSFYNVAGGGGGSGFLSPNCITTGGFSFLQTGANSMAYLDYGTTGMQAFPPMVSDPNYGSNREGFGGATCGSVSLTTGVNAACRGGNGFISVTPFATLPSYLAKTTTFTYTGTLQQFVVPATSSLILVKAWGAGGGSGSTYISSTVSQSWGGAAGGYTQCYLPVKGGTVLSILVGQGGMTASKNSDYLPSTLSTSLGWGGNTYGGYGGGGGATSPNCDVTYGICVGGGGGRSAISNGPELVTAGGGGGGGSVQVGTQAQNGAAGGGGGVAGANAAVQPYVSGYAYTPSTSCQATGGTQTAAGSIVGTNCFSAFPGIGVNGGTSLGDATRSTTIAGGGGGGGGGYFGGAAGVFSTGGTGGAGGSGYVSSQCLNTAAYPSFTYTGNSSSLQATQLLRPAMPPNGGDKVYLAGVGVGGVCASGIEMAATTRCKGGDGLVSITLIS